MRTMKNYHDLYLKYNVLLLVDVNEKCKNNSLKNYELYAPHYFSAPVLSWDATLNTTKVEFEFISDANMDLFFKQGMREEGFYISKRCSKGWIIWWVKVKGWVKGWEWAKWEWGDWIKGWVFEIL